jgi:cytochrome P450
VPCPAPAGGFLAADFAQEYVAGAVAPFLLSSVFAGETPMLPMIDLAFSKKDALAGHLWGLLYDGWTADSDRSGVSVFTQAYENRGPHNARKKIFMSATTPDLIDARYRGRLRRFHELLLAEEHAGRPLMRHFLDLYYELFWDLHVGADGGLPAVVRRFTADFTTVLGFWYPTSETVYRAYMRARADRPAVMAWLRARVQALVDGSAPKPERTLVHYWLRNGELGEDFSRDDILVECLHDLMAFPQWATMVHRVAGVLEPVRGDSQVRSWFTRTMREGPDETDGGPFTRLDRFVMELFRTISPNPGSLSTLRHTQALLGGGISGLVTPNAAANADPRHWEDPARFDPDRFRAAPTSADGDDARCRQAGLARCPFPREAFDVRDGRAVRLVNSGYGAVYSEVDGTPHPVCDTAGYAAFGFGYRRCPAEHLSVEFVKEFLRRVWQDGISFERLDVEVPEQVPVNPGTVADDITFRRASSA